MRQETASATPEAADADRRIAFQGEKGAFSHQACSEVFPDMVPLPCPTFEEAIATVRRGEARLAMLPVENSLYGRVADIHHLLPESGLYVIGEHFLPIRMQLLGLPDATLAGVKSAESLNVALGQVRRFLKDNEIRAVAGPDTAGSARAVSEAGDPARAAVASTLAGEVYGLKVLAADIEDASHNTTRFLVCSRRKVEAEPGTPAITSFVFRVRNLPASLYKALGGFATNGVNMVRLESYMLGGSFTATQFIADIDGHPEDVPVARALEELGYFTDYVRILGVYPPNEFRLRSDAG
jgi:prephenate dehydratase